MIPDFINTCIMISFALLIAAFFLVVWRLSKGPTIADRVLCLDMLTTIAIGFVIVVAIHTHRSAYLDVAIALGLVGFLATLAFARFILWRGTHSQKDQGEADG